MIDYRTEEFARHAVDENLRLLATDPSRGLASDQVAERLRQYGPNEIEEREEPLWHRIFRRFWGPIPWMIEIAAILSAVVGKWEDFSIILVMLLVNAGLDFMQEHRALNALKALKQRLAREARVLRDGEFHVVPVRELVPGDIIRLRIGDIVPADVQLMSGDYLLVDQSALTGESLPVSKESGEIAYASTIVKQGEMLALVINTGKRTHFSNVVSLVARAQLEARSHFQKMVIQVGNFLILVTLVLVALIILVSLFRHEVPLEIVRFAMVLTVAAIPVALPAVLSVTMAVGAMNLARRQAIVSRLTAIEELAGVDIFCSDKTGTLTCNEMRVVDPVVFDGHDERELFRIALMASRLENRDPIELPLFHYADEHFPDLGVKEIRPLEFTPFDPVRKRTEALVEADGRRFVAIKGAPQVLLSMAELDEDREQDLLKYVDLFASKGYRTLAVGRRPADDGNSGSAVELIGLIPLFDPPRDDSRQVIEDMRAHGVRVKMVTGDNAAIAREIGQLLGLEPRVLRAPQISGSGGSELIELVNALSTAIYHRFHPEVSLSEARRFAESVMDELQRLFDTSLLEREFLHTHESAIVEMIESIDIFAEVVPEDKYRIVSSLQRAGHIVAMTGDGVNDAPALKKADCGFAVSNATDAARAAADIILTGAGLSVINEAIKQARTIFERMKSYAIFRIAETIRIILFMALSIVIFDFYPITALMIILLALLNDIPILAIAYDRTRVHPQPVRWNMAELITVASVLGVTGVVSSFLLFFILQEQGIDEGLVRTLLFLKLIVAGHSTLYVTRSEGWFWERPWPAPVLFWATFGTEIIGTLIAVYGVFVDPIGWRWALGIWAYALAWFLFNDLVKVSTYRLLRSHGMQV
ncbi:plasma-membrane proton-efflux P-type ATPase [Thiohalobacter sp.]|uniref:plasma-membrane proton-efflux P-type ATPase n=1 Tax=Thiohalobacter sp. TaxID=2025948 RepID=UPI00261D0FD3|nr:plasma-membrane proton-efflux P-type ATPase [Thiohalobacter sp.]